MRRSLAVRTAVGTLLVLALAGCGTGGADSADGAGADRGGDRLRVAAAFYPLQWVSERVGGDRVTVENLTPPGTEPHDLELGPRQVGAIAEADLVVRLAGFQPAVDDAVTQEAGSRALDVTRAARLLGSDLHFWLDPIRLADVADEVATRLGALDAEDATGYTTRAADLRAELEALDAELREGLAGCAGTDLVTSHTAFRYLAERYDMEQVGISGLTPDAEPSPRDIADVAAYVRDNGVRTIYYETLVSPDVARAIARETGAGTAVLDPLEGLTEASAGEDYRSVMRANMATLRAGQPCR